MSKLNLTLYECLQQVSLEKYHGKFTERGILDVGGLLSLTMQDYPALGISSMADRQNLFYLIQTIKTMQVSSSQRGLLRNGTQNERLVPMEGPAAENKKGIILILEQTKCMRKSQRGIPFHLKPAPHLSLRDKYDVHPHTERSKNQSEYQGFP